MKRRRHALTHSQEGLERGREVLAKWGSRRCEDVVWIKTNKTTNKGLEVCNSLTGHTLFVQTVYKPFVILDTDVIILEGEPADPTRKPPEMYTLIENFCLGMRRLEIFGKLTSVR